MTSGLQIVFAGTAGFAIPVLRTLAAGPDRILLVVTRPDRPAGRGRRLRPSPVKVAAHELGLPIYQPQRLSSPEGLQRLRELSPDLLFVAAFGEILSGEALSLARLGAVNLHASLLPRYRGAAPIQRALLAGDRETGVTLQWMGPEIDAGDIILQRRVAIGEEEEFGSLHDRLAALGADLTCEAMELLRRGAAPRLPQDSREATYAPPIRSEELVMDWSRRAAELARVVRAFAPQPGARTTRQGRLLKVLSAREAGSKDERRGTPGRVSEVGSAGIQVEAGEGWLLVTRVQPAGRRIMSGGEYAQGYRLRVGERLGETKPPDLNRAE